MPHYRRRRSRRAPRFKTICEQIVFDITEGIPDLTGYFSDTLDDDDLGWYIQTEIICPPKVILILCREVETEEMEIRDEREQ